MSKITKIPRRQVHLDFHTSPYIEGIGKNFSKENFQAALKAGNLESITVFAKCHHSMCYYPTEVGTMHPHLEFDLTGAMVDAAHEIGVRAPIYITAGWSDGDNITHPEWAMLGKNREHIGGRDFSKNEDMNAPKPHVFWNMLCYCDGSPYSEHIYAITEEICRRYKVVDGLFYDICTIGEACYCESCIKGMKEMGLDPENDDDASKYLTIKRQVFFEKCGEILKKYHPDATIFFNGCAHQYKKDYHAYQSHFEMEDLPTAWDGYDRLPMRAKYFSKSGKGVIGMTGKFHLSWGEFGGFKSKDALKYEVATMALYGVGASVGDHMHPDGEMEMQTYENIGYAYNYLDKIAPYCFDGEAVTNIGVFTSPLRDANEGISNILLENQLDYDLVTNCNFDEFDTIIIPEKATMSVEELAAFDKYIKNGGKAFLMADALVKDGKFQIDLGFEYIGDSEFDCDYLSPVKKIDNVPNAPMLCNFPGHKVKVNDTAQVYAELLTPYFSRTYAHFCGHMNTPHNKDSERFPAIAKSGNVVYLAHSIPRAYLIYGPVFLRNYFMMALNLVYGGSILKVKNLGAQGRCTMIHQPQNSRYCINMIYASPVKRGKAQIIDDIVTMYNIDVELKLDKKVKKVYMPLENKKLKFSKKGDTISFTVPELNCHTTVVVEY